MFTAVIDPKTKTLKISVPCDTSQFALSKGGKMLLSPFGTGGWTVVGTLDGKPVKVQCNVGVPV